MAFHFCWLPARARASRNLLPLLALAFLLSGCGDDAPPAAPDEAAPQEGGGVEEHAGHDHAPAAGPLSEIRYVCPMHPNIVQDEPGQCPICGMNLVAREVPVAGSAAAAPESTAQPAAQAQGGTVALPAALQQSLGVRIGHPERRSLAPVFRVGARVVPDASGVVRLSARSGGWIERLNVRAVGDPVRRGAVVAEIYSAELVQAQEELLLGGASAAGARERLRRLGVAESDIEAIVQAGESRRRLPLRAPVDGVVAELGVRDGGAVDAGETLMEITPRSQVWIEAQLFPAQRMQLGDSVEGRFTMPGLPGTEWLAEASYIAPSVDPVTQTVAVRFPIPEAGDALALGAWLDAEISGARRDDVLVVPSSAVIRTRQGNRVVRVAGEGRFEPVAVDTGAMHGGWTEITSGLSTGDGIVLSGQFLIDSEAELSSGLQRMQAHDHSGER